MIVALQQIMRPGFILRGCDGAECADDEQNDEQRCRFSRPFDEARLLVTAQNLLPKRPNAPFYVLVHCTISSCQRGGSFWQILLWCKLCHTKRSTSPSCCRDLRSNLRSF